VVGQDQDPGPFQTLPIETNIRKQLREWEIENSGSYIPAPTLRKEDGGLGGVTNSSRNQNEMVDIDRDMEKIDEDNYTQVFERDELVDVGVKRTFLLPGDLVELR
jgi:hypothetical protein